MGTMRRRRWLLGGVVVATLAAAFAGASVWRASNAISDSATEIREQGKIRFREARLDRALPAGFEPIGSPASYRDMAMFGGLLYLAGPAGLKAVDSQGNVAAQYRPGFELPAAPVTVIAVARLAGAADAELFLGTNGEGLVAFDGKQFRQIRPEDARLRKVSALLVLKTGRILIGTEASGVLTYDGKSLGTFDPSLADVRVTALAGDDTSLWAGTQNRGLLHWHSGELAEISDLPDPHVLSLAIDGERVFAGTAMGTVEIINGRITRQVAPGYFAQSLLVRGDSLLVGTIEEGVVEAPLTVRPGRASAGAPMRFCEGCSVHRMLADGARLLTLSDTALYDNFRPMLQAEPAVLADRNISALSMDSRGQLWIGYFDRGLDILSSAGSARHVEDDHVFCVNRIVHATDHAETAVATANGLVLFDGAGNARRTLTKADGLIADHVTDAVWRSGGSLTLATPAGVTFTDASGSSSIYAFHGLVNNHAYALGASGTRTLVGTLGGLSMLEGSVITANYTTANSSLKHNWITGIVRVGEDWFVGTYGAGVLKLDPVGHWNSFPDWKGTAEINANAMAVTSSAVYAGTLGRGLAIYLRSAGRWRFQLDGLPSSNVTAVEAHGGNIYIGTENGLVRVPEANLVQP